MEKSNKKFWIILSIILAVCIAVSVTLAVVLTAPHKHPLKIHGEHRATCVQAGNIVYWECETCNKYFSDRRGKKQIELADTILPALGHNFVDSACSRCGYTVYPFTDHLEYSPITDATDTVVSYAVAGLGASDTNNIVIPETYNNLPVTEILSTAFSNTKIISLHIPASVRVIGEGTFNGCSKLQAITVDMYSEYFESQGGNLYSKGQGVLVRYAPANSSNSFAVGAMVRTIGVGAFQGATNLTTVTMTQTSNCHEIEALAFQDCINLQSVQIAPSVAIIGHDIFFNCGKLRELTLPFVGSAKNATSNSQYPLGYLFGTTQFNGGEPTRQIYGLSDTTADTTYYIPATLTTVSVTGGNLCYGAFYNCGNLARVTLSGVSGVGSHAFHGNHNLVDVHLSSVSKIAENAFVNCRALTIYCAASAKPDNWNRTWNSSAYPVVWNCESNDVADDENVYVLSGGLRFALIERTSTATVVVQPLNIAADVTVPAEVNHNNKNYSVTAIRQEAFSGCEQLTKVVVPVSVTYVGANAFANCPNLVIYCEAEEIPDGWDTNWNSDAAPVVVDCNNSQTDNSGNVYLLEDGIRYALKNGIATVVKLTKQLTTVTIPAKVTFDEVDYDVENIGEGAFANSTIASVILPESLLFIGTGAFENCKNLVEIVISTNVKYIEPRVFRGCEALTIYCERPEGDYSSFYDYKTGWCALSDTSDCPVVWNCRENDVATDGNVYVVANSVRYLLNSEGKATVTRQPNLISGSVVLPSAISHKGTSYAVTAIADYAFSGCTKLTGITIPNSVGTIGEHAFYACSALASVTLPRGITAIETECFTDCTALLSVIIPYSVQTIKMNAFLGCTKLTSVTFEMSSVCVTIGNGAFANCTSLDRITIPATVTTIGSLAFSRCLSLTSATFANTEGWLLSVTSSLTSGTAVDSALLADAKTAAAALVENSNYYWLCKQK